MPPQNSKPRQLRVLVIGAGPAAISMHLPVLARLRARGEIIPALVCDMVPERATMARRRFGFLEETGDADAAVARSDIDAVYIFAGAVQHHDYGLKALGHGKHVFVEKPIAPSFLQAQAMAQLARARGLVAVGGHNRRFFPSLAAARALAGRAGWSAAEAVFHKSELGKPPPFGARSWLSANGIHALDALIFMMGGLPEHVAAQATGLHVFSALMRWPGGAQGIFQCNNNAGGRREEYIFHAPGETCHVRETDLVLEKNGAITKTRFRLYNDGLHAEHESFLAAIRGESVPEHSLESLAPSLFLTERIEEGFTGPVQLPSPIRPLAIVPAAKRQAILLIDGARLQTQVARLTADYCLLSLDDVRRSATPRDDVVAALLGRNATMLPEDILPTLPNLALVGFAGLSLAQLKPEALLARGIALVHASEAYAESVAEFALALAILGRRRAFLSHRIMSDGGWGTDRDMTGLKGRMRQAARQLRPPLKAAGLEPFVLGAWRKAKPLFTTSPAQASAARDLKGASAGLIGWGANARAFARRLSAAGVRVLAWSEHADPDTSAVRVSLGEALAADIVSLHRGLTPATRHFLGKAELARIRPGAVLINVARGALIAPDALLARLRKGDIFACLDTYEDEPLPPSHPLRQLPNVFLTSHIAGGTPDMHAAAEEEVVAKMAAYLGGGRVETISADRLANMT